VITTLVLTSGFKLRVYFNTT